LPPTFAGRPLPLTSLLHAGHFMDESPIMADAPWYTHARSPPAVSVAHRAYLKMDAAIARASRPGDPSTAGRIGSVSRSQRLTAAEGAHRPSPAEAREVSASVRRRRFVFPHGRPYGDLFLSALFALNFSA